MDYIQLPVLAKTDVYKAHGMARVLCGVDASGNMHDEPNFAADMRRLAEGVWITIPDDILGGTRRVRLRCWIMVLCADYLAMQSLLPSAESTQAYRFCRTGCTFDRRHSHGYKPFSFLRAPAPMPGSGKAAKTSPPYELLPWAKVSPPAL